MPLNALTRNNNTSKDYCTSVRCVWCACTQETDRNNKSEKSRIQRLSPKNSLELITEIDRFKFLSCRKCLYDITFDRKIL